MEDEQKNSNKKLSFDAYYASARLVKKSHRLDCDYWKNHVSHTDYETREGIENTLANLKDKGYAPATVRHVFTFIKRFHNWHIENDLHPTGINPAAKIKLPKVDNRLNDGLTEKEAAGLLDYLPKHKNRPMALIVGLGLLTGRRQGELLDLRKEDVDLSIGFMTCRNTKNGKTLTFPLNQTAIEYLKEAFRIAPEESLTLFQYTRHGFKTNWYRLLKRLLQAGVITKKIRYHSLRHTYATLLANSGKVDIHVLQRLLGHSTIELTQRYASILDKTTKKATRVLDDIF